MCRVLLCTDQWINRTPFGAYWKYVVVKVLALATGWAGFE
jgi:hypothetical protein